MFSFKRDLNNVCNNVSQKDQIKPIKHTSNPALGFQPCSFFFFPAIFLNMQNLKQKGLISKTNASNFHSSLYGVVMDRTIAALKIISIKIILENT